MQPTTPLVSQRLRDAKVLVVDDEFYSRKVIRTLLLANGVTRIFDANNGARGLEAIPLVMPDLVLLDWEMPNTDGPSFVKTVRNPETFPLPDVPIIMLTGHSERWRVEEAISIGVNEYLLKPVSSKMLASRLVSTLVKPRPIVRVGNYYGPEPRPAAAFKPVDESFQDDIVLLA